jgi:cob(I)alamin adenosyltransferase
LYKYENKNIQKIINKIHNEIFIKNTEFAIKNSKELINLINKSIEKIKENYHDNEKRINIIKDIYIKFTENQNIY